jgi:CubicO group peptidase (beta-lactamase class C family)/tRNA A-37 threonylcarbamoyl transferase component Bud32
LENQGKLGKYDLRRKLGQGAMGEVYEAWDPAIHRPVAIKTLSHPAQDVGDELYARFRREVQAAGRLSHPNIVNVYDYGETDDSAYIVMQYVAGVSLDAHLRALGDNAQLPLAELGRIMGGILAGLQHGHERGVVHRDIKPSNVLLADDGSVKITDYGIAHLEQSDLTQAGDLLGTPAYMAPEQVAGHVIDLRADLYAAGVVLFQLLTGRRPFEGSQSSVLHKIIHAEPAAPSTMRADLPSGLDAVVYKALAKRPLDRFASASEFARALQANLAPLGAGLPTANLVALHLHDMTVADKAQPGPKNRRWWLLSALAVGGLGAVALVLWLQARPRLDAFDAAIRRWTESYNVPGASLAVMHHDRLVFASGYGNRQAGDRVPIWGLTKPITALCVTSLVDEGKLRLSDPILPLLPPRFRPDAQADSRWSLITVQQLLDHRSGLPGRGPWGGFAPEVGELLQQLRPEQISARQIAPDIARLPLQTTPGSRYELSQINYLLLGEIIGTLVGTSYADACRERVLKRAGIQDARLAPRWGALTSASNGWALSAPEYLGFMRLLEPASLGPTARSLLTQSDDWTDASHAETYRLGLFVKQGPSRYTVFGGWWWKMDHSAAGPIDDRAGALAVLTSDTAWVATFDRISTDTDLAAMQELDRALWRAFNAMQVWPGNDLFSRFDVGPLQ